MLKEVPFDDWYEDKEKLELKLLYWEDYYIKKYNAIERGYNKEYTLSKVMCGEKALQFARAETTLPDIQRFIITYAQENIGKKKVVHDNVDNEEEKKRAELEEKYKSYPFKEIFINRELREWQQERDLATGKVKKPFGL